VKEQLPKKPRAYRREARTAYLQIAKQRKPNRKKIRKAMSQLLGYVRRNLAHIDTLIAAGAMLSELKKNLYRNLLLISEVYRQQQLMYEQGCHRIDDRIVSITQPHVRPIVRGSQEHLWSLALNSQLVVWMVMHFSTISVGITSMNRGICSIKWNCLNLALNIILKQFTLTRFTALPAIVPIVEIWVFGLRLRLWADLYPMM
jgi:hypothetical protein